MENRVRTLIINAAAAAASLLPSTAVAADASCVKHEDHDGMTFFLVDRTDKHDPTRVEALKKTFLAVKEMVKPGERLVIGVSTGKATDTRVDIDVVRPKASWLESAMKTRAKDKAFTDCLASAEKALLDHEEEYKTSALVETLSFVSKIIRGGTGTKRLVMFSDMVENGPIVSFVKSETVDTKKAIEAFKKEQMVWDLKSLPVYVSGVGQGSSDRKVIQLEQFWKAYFAEAGAEMKFFGPIFLGPDA